MELLKKVKNILKKDAAVMTAVITVSIWIIKSAWYSYQVGRLSVYHISPANINLSNDKILLDILLFFSAFLLVGFSNYTHYKLCHEEDGHKGLFLLIFEVFLIFVGVVLSSGVDICELMKTMKLRYFVIVIALSGVLCFVINSYSFAWILSEKIVKRKTKIREEESVEDSTPKTGTHEGNKIVIYTLLLGVAVGILGMFFLGIVIEKQKVSYNVIFEQKQNAQMGDVVYDMYPVVYETADKYYLSKIKLSENGIKMDDGYQRVVAKEGVETHYFSNIYEMNVDKIRVTEDVKTE